MNEIPNSSPIKQNKHADKVNNKPHLKYFDAVVILATFNTSGSIILIPWSYGQLGYIVGPLTHLAIVVVVVGMVLYFNCFLIDVATTAGSKGIKCRTLGDVGKSLAGRMFTNVKYNTLHTCGYGNSGAIAAISKWL